MPDLPHPSPLPDNLPVPENDGACDYLVGHDVPDIQLPGTSGRLINLRSEFSGRAVIFFYPRTGEPGSSSNADWDMIPGARGCHHHFCGFRNIHEEFKREDFSIFAASTQNSDYQREFIERMHIPFEAISDDRFLLADALHLPTFSYQSQRLIKRLTLIIHRGRIMHVFYPVFPPDKNADAVLMWIRANRSLFA